MLEEFIAVALEAFTNASGDIDKFELQLRRKLMSYNSNAMLTAPQVVQQPVVPVQFPSVMPTLDIDDSIFAELENVDISQLNDEQILDLAKRMGFMTTIDESTSVEGIDE